MENHVVLDGFGLRLEPLGEQHARELGASVDDALWAGRSVPTPRGTPAMAAYVRDGDAGAPVRASVRRRGLSRRP